MKAIFLRVVNELRISGAQGLAINGQRITSNSYIKCTGPVITVDGRTFPAPFVIEAIGDADVLSSSLYLKGGVIDGLIRDNIVVTTEQSKEIQFVCIAGRKQLIQCRGGWTDEKNNPLEIHIWSCSLSGL